MKITTELLFFIALTGLIACKQVSTTVKSTVSSRSVEVSTTALPEASSTPASSSPPETRAEWKGKIDGIEYAWTTNELEIRNEGKVRNIFSDISKAYSKTLFESPENNGCLVEHFLKPISVVNSLFAFEHEVAISCGAVSSSFWRYTTMDVRWPGDYVYSRIVEFETQKPKRKPESKIVSLLDLFSPQDILNALLANQRISDDLAQLVEGRFISARPKTLSEFSSFYTKNTRNAFGGYFYLESDFLTRFAFHRIEDGNVAVRISLSATSNASASAHEFIEVLLPPTVELRERLQLADTGQQGFLMKDAAKKVGTGSAQFEFDKN